MSGESAASRAGQIARQIMLFGRPIPNDELMERLSKITVERLMDLAGRLFIDAVADGLPQSDPFRSWRAMKTYAPQLSSGAPLKQAAAG